MLSEVIDATFRAHSLVINPDVNAMPHNLASVSLSPTIVTDPPNALTRYRLSC